MMRKYAEKHVSARIAVGEDMGNRGEDGCNSDAAFVAEIADTNNHTIRKIQ